MKKFGFRGLSHMDADMRILINEGVKEVPKDSLMTQIFAPDPSTGLPCASALLSIQNGSIDPSTRELLRQRFFAPTQVSDVGNDDPDLVAKYTKTQFERFESYVNRLVKGVEKTE